MANPRDRASSLQATYESWLALGCERTEGPGCYGTRSPLLPNVYDANMIAGVRAETPAEVADLLAFAEELHGRLGHRHILAGPDTSPAALAAFVQAGFAMDQALQLLLEGELQGPKPEPHEIRRALSEEDWRSAARLLRMWNEESNEEPDAKFRFSEETSRQIAASLRAKDPAHRTFLLRLDGLDVAFFGAYPGLDGIGMVEDLYTIRAYRKRGLARALIHHCVADARERGAEAVLIGADTDDTPRFFYESLGFVPTCLTWSLLRRVGDPRP